MSGNAAREIAVPHFVGRYEVLVPIASGGMATVYLARSRGAGGFEREVALKLTHAHLRESPEFQELLIEEAKLASAIRHQNVVSVLDVGDDPLGLFLVMDYVEGDTLSGLMRRARTVGPPIPRPIALRALLDAVAGLHAAHETLDAEGQLLHVVHRDFSPQNILVGLDGIARLTDFGIAKAVSRIGNTSAGMLKGKIAYMSPEHARGTPIDRRSDVWAAGVLAWEIVAGRPLWPREDEDVAMLIKLVTTSPPRLSEVVPDVAEALGDAVARALAMDRDERWPTAAAFGQALASSTEVADAGQLAAYVREVSGPKIAQRRQQIRSMRALRTQMGQIAEATSMTPSGRYLQPHAALAAPPADRVEVEIDVQPTEFALAPSFSEPPPPPNVAPLDVVSSSMMRPSPAPPLAPWWVPAAAGVVVALSAVAIVVGLAVRHPSTPVSETTRAAGAAGVIASSPEPVVPTPTAVPPEMPASAPSAGASPAAPPSAAQASSSSPRPQPRAPLAPPVAVAQHSSVSPAAPSPATPNAGTTKSTRAAVRAAPVGSSQLAPSPY